MTRHTGEDWAIRRDAIGYGGAVVDVVVGAVVPADLAGGEGSFDRGELASVVNGGEA